MGVWGRSNALLLAALLLSGSGLSACSDATGPHIDALVPGRAPAGAIVEVVGERFNGTERTVAFGGAAAKVLVWGDKRARVIVPAGKTGLTPVVVKVDGQVSNPVDFYSTNATADGGS